MSFVIKVFPRRPNNLLLATISAHIAHSGQELDTKLIERGTKYLQPSPATSCTSMRSRC